MNDEMFVLIEASKLSMDDEFMQYRPKTAREKEFKDLLEDVIRNEIDDFWHPRIDPTLDEVENICFKVGKKPAVGNSYNWWRENAKKFNPMHNSRLGTKSQYIAFIGVFIKTLVVEGWMVDEAWNAVCNDSQKLGHYWNSENAKHKFELTGSRVIAGFCDLANTIKILADDEDAGVFWFAGGGYNFNSVRNPLVDLGNSSNCNGRQSMCVGWIVMD